MTNYLVDIENARLLKISEAATTLHVHENTIRRWCDSGKLPSFRISQRGDRRIQESDVRNMIKELVYK
jgi:excisionase family DNA binding protein